MEVAMLSNAVTAKRTMRNLMAGERRVKCWDKSCRVTYKEKTCGRSISNIIYNEQKRAAGWRSFPEVEFTKGIFMEIQDLQRARKVYAASAEKLGI